MCSLMRDHCLSKRSAFSFGLFAFNASKVALGEDACFPTGLERGVGPQ